MKNNINMSPRPIQGHPSDPSLSDHSKELVYVSIEIPKLRIACIRGNIDGQNDLKACIWENYKDKLYEKLQVHYEDQNKSPQSSYVNQKEVEKAIISKPSHQATDHKEALKDYTKLVEQKVQERTDELREANERLVEANRQVKEAAAIQLEHFACMSREIRTPLNCILGLSSLLQEMTLPPSMQESMDMILSSGQLLLSVVNDVLDYAKLTSGNVEIESVESSSQELFDTVISSLENETSTCTRGISITTKYDPALPLTIKTDPNRLQQILYNLMGNAIKFSKKNGEVELRVEVVDEEDPDNDAGSDNASRGYCFECPPSTDDCNPINSRHTKRLHLCVKDYGKGIEKANFERIFRPLPQSNTLTVADREFGGTGLGLAITAKLVHRLGGSISVNSELGKWTEFTVDLPLRDEPANVKSLTASLGNVTVLLVDNDLETISLMVCVFSFYKMNLLCFQNMEELRMKTSFLDKAQSYICIVREDLYQEKRYYELSRRVFQSALVMTGPEYTYGVMESKMHFHSLPRIVPSVLMKALGETLDTSEVGDELQVEQIRPANMSSLRVLIAEDNVVNLKVLRRILERLGIKNIDAVGNGKLAVEQEVSKEYDVVFMDMQMPEMDGIDACRLIVGRKGGHPKPKIVFVTAHIQDSFKAECLEAGAVGFLGKPFTIYGIENCLDELWE